MTFPIDTCLTALKKEVQKYNVPVVDLIAVQTKDPFKVLVATILSARTKDATTAKAAERLFAQAATPEALASLPESTIQKLIYPVGFYKAKAGYLAKLPAALAQTNGQVPQEIEGLLKLPGVGRKTANLVLAVAFQKEAICVDTHVHRIMNIWGYVETKNPMETEMALRQKLPKPYWLKVNALLVAFGQSVCRPVAPHCDICPIREHCPQRGVTPRKVHSKQRPTDTKTFLSWNVNGIRAIEKKGFIDLVTDLAPDIIALQETKAQPEQLSEALKDIHGYRSYWHSAERKGYSGLGIYAKEEPQRVLEGLGVDHFDCEGRVLTLEFDDFYFINAYFPNAQHGLGRLQYKLDFNRALHTFVDECAAQKSVVLCGDFNVAHKPIDLKNPESNQKNPGYTPQERAWMDSFTQAGYIDTFRKFHPEPEQYTWWSYRFNARARNIGWRIDYFIVDGKSDARIVDAGIHSNILGSDHCPIFLEYR